MEFNPDVNKQATELLFSQITNRPFHPPLFFSGIEVTKINEQKHLGIILDANHINVKIKTAQKSVERIIRLSRCLSIRTLIQMYKTLVRPPLDNLFNHDRTLNYIMERIEKLQHQAALAITGV